mmetsp:Transcript_3412/g.10428  ORF Transcript_3412/g.10428 Transcript_3412/m.10428 type:complete len:230 (+) Transcript_3412:49-738(+)
MPPRRKKEDGAAAATLDIRQFFVTKKSKKNTGDRRDGAVVVSSTKQEPEDAEEQDDDARAPLTRASSRRVVPGEECRVAVPQLPGVWVVPRCLGSAARSWSKIYVPLVFCALGDVPADCVATMGLTPRQAVATPSQIRAATAWWADRASEWNAWIAAVRALVDSRGRAAFVRDTIMRPRPRGKTTLVFGQGAAFGYLPHPHARNQERILADAAIDGQVACCAALLSSSE